MLQASGRGWEPVAGAGSQRRLPAVPAWAAAKIGVCPVLEAREALAPWASRSRATSALRYEHARKSAVVSPTCQS